MLPDCTPTTPPVDPLDPHADLSPATVEGVLELTLKLEARRTDCGEPQTVLTVKAIERQLIRCGIDPESLEVRQAAADFLRSRGWRPGPSLSVYDRAFGCSPTWQSGELGVDHPPSAVDLSKVNVMNVMTSTNGCATDACVTTSSAGVPPCGLRDGVSDVGGGLLPDGDGGNLQDEAHLVLVEGD